MIITAFFSYDGAPKTGLNASLTIYNISDGSAVTTGAAVTEVAGGFYKYDFSAFTNTGNYAFVFDGGATQPAGERYAVTTSGQYGDIEFIKDIEGGRWKIDTVLNQMIFYKSDNSTTVATFDLKGSGETATTENVFERTRA